MTKHKKNKLSLCLLSLCLSLLLVGCGSSNSGNTPAASTTADTGLAATIKASPYKYNVGLTGPGQGTDFYMGIIGDGGASVAGELANHVGGVFFQNNGYYIQFKPHEDASLPEGVASAVTQMVNEEDVTDFIGPYSVEGLASNLRLIKDLATPELLMLTSNTLLDQTRQNPNLFYLRPLEPNWATAVVSYLKNNNLLKPNVKVGLVGQTTNEGQTGIGLIKQLLQSSANVGPTVEVTTNDYDQKKFEQHDQYATQVQILVKANPDIIINWSNVNESIELFQELRNAGWKGQYVTSNLNDHFIESLKGQAEGVIGPMTWANTETDAASQTFLNEWKQLFTAEATPDDHSAAVYDGVRMLMDAFKQVGPDKTKIRDWLAHLQNWQGLQGTYTAQPDGELITSVKMAQVKNGHLVLVSGS